tara:strand:+ start:18822 stop:19553 length:732 start_codon:yes stop_codon:yes gene_type:complete
MKVVVLTAGRGSRLNLNLPKSIVKVDDRCMLDIQLSQLYLAGIKPDDITIVTGFKKNLFSKYNFKQVNNKFYKNTGQVFSISCASHLAREKEVIVIYGDILFEKELILELNNFTYDFVVPSYSNFKNLWIKRGDSDFKDLETFKTNNGKLLEIGNEVDNIELVNGQFMGILYFNNFYFSNFLEWYSRYKKHYGLKASNVLQTTTFLNYLINNDVDIFSTNYKGYFMELDSNEDLKLIQNTLKI